MKQDGFTLLELVIVMAIAGVLLTIGTMIFSDRLTKDKVEGQVKSTYADLMNVRTRAIFEKRTRSVVVSATSYSIYSSSNVGVKPIQQTAWKVPVTSVPSPLQIDYDEQGMAVFNVNPAPAPTDQAAICLGRNKGTYIDSILLSRSQIQVGKLTGTGCVIANITIR